MLLYTRITYITMEGSKWTRYLTSLANFESIFFPLYIGYILYIYTPIYIIQFTDSPLCITICIPRQHPGICK